MPLLLFALVVLLVLLVWPKRHALSGGPLALRVVFWGGFVVLALILVRAGLGWLAATAGGVVFLLNRVVPLLRAVGPEARPSERGSAPPRGMTLDEAREILGVEEGAPREAVLSRYRHLMKHLHPDRGGSSRLAARVNEAKDRLLEG